MNIEMILNKSKKNKQRKGVIKYTRVDDDKLYDATITDCSIEESRIKLEVAFFTENGVAEKEFYFNIKGSSAFYLNNILDILEVNDSNISELVGMCCKAMVKRKGTYETFVVVKAITEEELKSDNLTQKEDVVENKSEKYKKKITCMSKHVIPKPSLYKKNLSKSRIEECDNEDIDFGEEED